MPRNKTHQSTPTFWERNRVRFFIALGLAPLLGSWIGPGLLVAGAFSAFVAPPFGFAAYLIALSVGAVAAFAITATVTGLTAYFVSRKEEQIRLDEKIKAIRAKHNIVEGLHLAPRSVEPIVAPPQLTSNKNPFFSSAQERVSNSDGHLADPHLHPGVKKSQ